MPKATIENNSMPIGTYTCEFELVEEVPHVEYGDGWKWVFEVVEGAHKGRVCFRTTKDKPTPKNSCGRFLAALAGTTPTDGQDIDTDDHIGQRYTVMIEASPSGESTRIGSFVPIGDQKGVSKNSPNSTDGIPF